MIQIDLSGITPFVDESAFQEIRPKLYSARQSLLDGSCRGNEFLGWLRLPETYPPSELARVRQAAAEIRQHSEVLVVIGIGGSYLGAKAAIDFLRSPNYNLKKKTTPDIYFAGNGLSAEAAAEIIELIGDRRFSINVISKSGGTVEPAVAFRLFRALLIRKVGAEEAKKRIYCTTDTEKGALKSLADREGYPCFPIPDNIGGRFSVLTPVGLLPMAVAGIDLDAVLLGALSAMDCLLTKQKDNQAVEYAAARNLLYERGKRIEILAYYEPSLRYFAEWFKQLFGESEGKERKGIFPASVEFTADLHSMGQYIQDGERSLFETVISIQTSRRELEIPPDEQDLDGLGFLAGKDLRFVSEMARKGTALAHIDGGVPNILLSVEARSPRSFGELVYFFELSCALSGLYLGVNPFDQPGVEDYKRNMFALIGKPGYEELRALLEARF